MAGKGGENSKVERKGPRLGAHQKKKSGIRTIFVNIVPFGLTKIRTRRNSHSHISRGTGTLNPSRWDRVSSAKKMVSDLAIVALGDLLLHLQHDGESYYGSRFTFPTPP